MIFAAIGDKTEPPPLRDQAASEGGDWDVLQSHRGLIILLLGFGGLTCWPLAIAAWMLGKKDLEAMRAGRMDKSGENATNAGYVCGIIGSCMGAAAMFFACIYFAFIMSLVGSFTSGIGTLTSGSKLTKSNYNKIQRGMTEADVERILGVGDEVSSAGINVPGFVSTSAKVKQWQEGMKVIVVSYSDGRVIAKSQSGL